MNCIFYLLNIIFNFPHLFSFLEFIKKFMNFDKLIISKIRKTTNLNNDIKSIFLEFTFSLEKPIEHFFIQRRDTKLNWIIKIWNNKKQIIKIIKKL